MLRKVIEPFETFVDGGLRTTLECGHARDNETLTEDELADDAPADCRIAGEEVWCTECSPRLWLN
jgi:hypothetical protein